MSAGHYSTTANSVRVDFFKKSGKWYATEAVMWLDYREKDIHKGLRDSLIAGGFHQRFSGMRAVCIEPYHEHEFPIMLIVPSADAEPLPSFERDPFERDASGQD